MNNKLDAALQEFVSEGYEILQRVSDSLQELEKGSRDTEVLGSVYRDMHTLKGTAQLFGFNEIGKLAHVLEASLDPIRKNNLVISKRLNEYCFNSLDLFGKMLTSVQNTKSDQGFSEEILKIVSLLIDAATHQFDSEILIQNEVLMGNDLQGNLKNQRIVADNRIFSPSEIIVKDVKEMMNNNASYISNANNSLADTSSVLGHELTIRVQVSLLDNLMNMIGELVLVRNQVLQYKNKHEDSELHVLSKNLDVVTTQLQTEVMKTRMQPISSVLSKFQRVVRDLSKDLNKQIDLTLEGMDTELDKTLLEAIKDPITHLVRNACDHGIESPAQRKAVGKPENGHLLIRAFHEGGHVVIEISDDGKGLDRKNLLTKAVEKGFVSENKAQTMLDKEVYNLIFIPGFSTADTVSSVSGRGVGMDVVKTNIEKTGGTIELNSTNGKGMIVIIKIPLTLAIVPALLVKTNNEKYAIPQVKLVELVRIEINDDSSAIEYLHGKPMLRLRGNLLVLVDLRELTNKEFVRPEYKDLNIMVLNAESKIFGLIVDEVLDIADIVVKPLSIFLKHLSLYSGATILGDGSVAIILDVLGMASASNINTQRTKEMDSSLSNINGLTKKSFDTQEFLLVDLGMGVTHAIPLCLVHRLEEFPLESIELSGKQKVVRYRDQLLPILDLFEMLNYPSESSHNGYKQDIESVVVVQKSGKYFGLKVNEVTDIITSESVIDDSVCDRLGILGNIVHKQTVIVVIDILGLLEIKQLDLKKGQPELVEMSQIKSKKNLEKIKSLNVDMKSKKVRVLYAEDVAFFRKHVIKFLSDAGFEVTVFEDGEKAFDALDKSYENEFNIILSDIEMPNMDGLQFAREVRKREKFKHIPMIALTTRFKQSDIDAGLKAGFTTYMEKLDPEKLLTKISDLMNLSQEEVRRYEV